MLIPQTKYRARIEYILGSLADALAVVKYLSDHEVQNTVANIVNEDGDQAEPLLSSDIKHVTLQHLTAYYYRVEVIAEYVLADEFSDEPLDVLFPHNFTDLRTYHMSGVAGCITPLANGIANDESVTEVSE